MSFSSINLRLRMKQAGITGTQLAKELGVSPSTVSNWCKNKQVPYYQRMKVADSLSKHREPAKPRTKLRKYRNTVPTEPQIKRTYADGYSQAMSLVNVMVNVPTDIHTKLRLLKTLSSTGESR